MRLLRLCAPLALLCSTTPAFADTLATGAPSDLLEIDDEWVTGLNQPTGMAFLPDGRMVITERAGTVLVRNTDGAVVEAGTISGVSTSFQEKGLLNVVVHPDYATNNRVFFYYTASGGGSDQNRVVSMVLDADSSLDTGSSQTIVEGIAAPLNHDGGGLAIYGNYLYVGTGDSGSNTNAEPDQLQVGNYYPTCFTNLNGKVLRFNLDGTIPSDNPLVGATVDACGNSPGAEPTMTSTSPREEIFAWGFRNAYRLWADPLTGNVWVGHVGEVTFEMINVVAPAGGEHHGWPFREGNDGAPASACEDVEPNVGACKDAVYRCESSSGNPGTGDYDPDVPDQCDCVIGGLILTGCEWPAELEGRYVFGDYTNERVWTLQLNDERNDVIAERVDFMTPQGGGPANFVEYQGALYIAVYGGNGHITRIAPQNPEAACDGQTPGPGPVNNGGSGGGAAGGAMGMGGSMAAGGNGMAAGGNGMAAGGNGMAAGGSGMGPVGNGGAGTPAGGDGPGPTPNPGGAGGPAVVTPPGGGGGGAVPPGPNPTPTPPGPTPVVTPGSGGSGTQAPGGPGVTPSPSASGAAGGSSVSDDGDAGDDGCGCRTVGTTSGSSGPAGLFALGLAALACATRRRRRG